MKSRCIYCGEREIRTPISLLCAECSELIDATYPRMIDPRKQGKQLNRGWPPGSQDGE